MQSPSCFQGTNQTRCRQRGPHQHLKEQQTGKEINTENYFETNHDLKLHKPREKKPKYFYFFKISEMF
jgi:hypothetical protein